jgi:hypothetical protein
MEEPKTRRETKKDQRVKSQGKNGQISRKHVDNVVNNLDKSLKVKTNNK